MSWNISFHEKAIEDLQELDNSVRIQVLKAINKVSKNPLSIHDGGYGKPLGNKSNSQLYGFYKIKLQQLGIRVVYHLIKAESEMRIIVIAARSDNKVYLEASKRK